MCVHKGGKYKTFYIVYTCVLKIVASAFVYNYVRESVCVCVCVCVCVSVSVCVCECVSA